MIRVVFFDADLIRLAAGILVSWGSLFSLCKCWVYVLLFKS